MGRPRKAVNTMSKNLTKQEKLERTEAEESLKGNRDKIIAPEFLTEEQKIIFNYIKDELEESKLLTNLDIYVLSTCSIAIERLQFIESKINKQPALLFKKELMSAKDKYSKDLYRCMNELSLSPQSRAKIAGININANAKKEDPVLKALGRS